MTTSPSWKPAGYTSVSPYLVTVRAEAVIAFLVDGVGGSVLRRYDRPDGSLMHAEIGIDDSVVMIGEAGGDWPPKPCHIHVYVADVDESHARALTAGGEEVAAPSRRPGDPDRRSGVRDPAGNTWWFGSQVE